MVKSEATVREANDAAIRSETRNGVVYLAFGAVFAAKALYSAKTVRQHNPSAGICVVSNMEFPGSDAIEFWNSDIDHWVFIDDASERNRQYKTNIIRYSPFEKTIYIDCDTFVTGRLDNAWAFLDWFDLAFRFQEGSQRHKDLVNLKLIRDIPLPQLPHWAGGVVLFKTNAKVKEFFERWHQNFNQSGLDFDQPSLVKTIFESDVKLLSLDTRWNGGFKPVDRDDGKIPLIIHYHSMYDSRIERGLRFFYDLISGDVEADKNEMEEHIRDRNRMRLRKEHIVFLLRRLYRKWWYRRYRSEVNP